LPSKEKTVAQSLGAKKGELAGPVIPADTILGKSILYALQEKRARNEMFLPGRMAFLFDLEDDFPQELPTTLLRSKEDCPKETSSIAGKIDALLLEKVTKVMTFLRQGSKSHKKLKKKDKAGTEEAKVNGGPKESTPTLVNTHVKKEEEEDDIFTDAGTDYVVAPSKKKDENKEATKEAKKEATKEATKETETKKEQDKDHHKRESVRREDKDLRKDKRDAKDTKEDRGRREERKPSAYFQSGAESEDIYKSETSIAAQQALAQAQALANIESKKEEKEKKNSDKRKGVDEREKETSFVSDTYTECYPGAYETAMYAYESDEEEDLTKMDMGGNKKAKLKRWDFEDEESWSAYNDMREATPKAAFQFGVKMADGRKTRRTTTKEDKMNSDLQKIKGIMKQRAIDSVNAKKLPDEEFAGEDTGSRKKRRVRDED